MLDLSGGVTARLLWFGGAHTKGDELTFVEPDKTLISGDVVQNKVVPNIYGDGGTPSGWIAVHDQVERLGAAHVLPTHSPVGDGSLVAKERPLSSTCGPALLVSSNRASTPNKLAGCLPPNSRPNTQTGPSLPWLTS
jgi:glyoxylase-like metal-dependent hydrolase (beta-lactamase superfamily II)